MPQPRQLISKNYHHIKENPILSSLFPRENLVGELEDCQIYQKFCHLQSSRVLMMEEGVQVLMVMMGLLVMVGLVEWILLGQEEDRGGMDHTTASHIKQRGGVTPVVT